MDVNDVVEGHDGGLLLLRNTCMFVYGFGLKLCINLGGACFAVYLLIMAIEDVRRQRDDDDVSKGSKQRQHQGDHHHHHHRIAWNWSTLFSILSCLMFFSFFMCGLVSACYTIFTQFFATQKIEPVDNTATAREEEEVWVYNIKESMWLIINGNNWVVFLFL